jgi:transaldolase
MNNAERLYELGQSLWYDNIRREMLRNGEMRKMIEASTIFGVTSNPSIFNSAIGKSGDYDESLRQLAGDGLSAEQVLEELAVEDIRIACDLFGEVYERTEGRDGFVSLEVSPDLAFDTEATCAEVDRLWQKVGRRNLMVKIPATSEGLPAIRRSTARGINVNVTLIFSRRRYREVMDAYLQGLEDRLQEGEALGGVASVASFFVSRIDTAVDALLQPAVERGERLAERLLGKIAIANARLAYGDFRARFGERDSQILREKGATPQRPLWASTSTKNPAYPDTLYVDNLIGPDTVNTVPPETLVAFLDHGVTRSSLEASPDDAEACLRDLGSLGISLDEVTDALERDGVTKFGQAYHELLETIEARRVAGLHTGG